MDKKILQAQILTDLTEFAKDYEQGLVSEDEIVSWLMDLYAILKQLRQEIVDDSIEKSNK